MTQDEKRKCAEVWELVTGDKTSPSEWCKEAGDELVAMLAAIRGCSETMIFVPRPVGSRPGYGWIVKYVYDVLTQRYRKGEFEICKVVGLYKWKRSVKIKLGFCN